MGFCGGDCFVKVMTAFNENGALGLYLITDLRLHFFLFLIEMLLPISAGRTLHILAEHLRVIARAGEAHAVRDLGDGQVFITEQRKALLNTVTNKEVKRGLMHDLLEQAAEFAFACMAGSSYFIQSYGVLIMLVYKCKRVFQPLQLLGFDRIKGSAVMGEELLIGLVNQGPNLGKRALDMKLIA